MSHEGTHVNHCCAEHGCKYGDDDCVVYNGIAKQLYPCEDCDNEPTVIDGFKQALTTMKLDFREVKDYYGDWTMVILDNSSKTTFMFDKDGNYMSDRWLE